MQRSTDRILTTHTGSLPRPEDLTKTMFAKEEGVPVDAAALAARIEAAVAEVVGKQVAAGIDVVDDGEYSKPSYATYVKDRLHGFKGKSEPLQYRDLVDFPGMARRVFGDPGRARRKTPACTEPVALRDPEAARTDVANLQAAPARPGARGVPHRRLPGGDLALLQQRALSEPRGATSSPSRRRWRTSTRRWRARASCCRSTAPTSAWAGISSSPTSASRSSARWPALHIEALDHALANVPPEQIRMHVCWGNYEGPHHFDVALADIIDLVLAARATAVSFEGANPRHAHEWRVFETVRVPDGKTIIPGVIDSTTNFIEHPPLVAERIAPLRAPGGPRERHGGHRLRLRHLGGPGRGGSGHRVGQAGQPGRGRSPGVARALVRQARRGELGSGAAAGSASPRRRRPVLRSGGQQVCALGAASFTLKVVVKLSSHTSSAMRPCSSVPSK